MTQSENHKPEVKINHDELGKRFLMVLFLLLGAEKLSCFFLFFPLYCPERLRNITYKTSNNSNNSPLPHSNKGNEIKTKI
jgi:hypothetical protein